MHSMNVLRIQCMSHVDIFMMHLWCFCVLFEALKLQHIIKKISFNVQWKNVFDGLNWHEGEKWQN